MAFDLTLEWAESMVLLGRFLEATGIMQQIYPTIGRWRAPMDILRSWKMVQNAIRAQSVQPAAFRELSLALRRSWNRQHGSS